MGMFSNVFNEASEQKLEQNDLFSRFEKAEMLMSTSGDIEKNRTQLYDLFSSNKWYALDYDVRCKAIQALENDFAYQQGRPAKEVVVAPLENGLYGGWSAKQDKILFNENLVKYGSLYNDMYSVAMPDANMQIFDTVAHEGYHAFQSFALEHPELYSNKQQLREWALNEGKYYEKGDQYLIQPQERDAWTYGYQSTIAAFQGIEARNGIEPGRQEYENNAAMSSYSTALQREQARDPYVLQHMSQEMEAECISKGIQYNYDSIGVGQTAIYAQGSTRQEEIEVFSVQNDESNGIDYSGAYGSRAESTEASEYLGTAQTPSYEEINNQSYLDAATLGGNEPSKDEKRDYDVGML